MNRTKPTVYLADETDSVICGVCGGLARAMGIDTWIVRLVVAVSFFGYGFGLIPYIILAIVLDDEADWDDREDYPG